MTKHKNQRVAVLVDAANMYHSAKNLYKRRVNFKEVLKASLADRQLIRAIAYVIHGAGEEESSFFEALDSQGFEVIIKDLQIFTGGARKADWDVGIAIDAIKLADHVDVIVLVSGDGDYLPLVEYLQVAKGVRVEVAAFRQTTSSKLIESVNDFVNLSDSRKFLIGR